MNIDYQAEVKKVYPDAADHYNELLKCWFVKNENISWEYYGQSRQGRNEAWQSAYNELKKQEKL